ncbi:uncharacterized protein LOC113360252 [Papaver somniferum]|uniref:uncharacterized protein LOC113360252 n=1 Tax=Papaver somniferum TaxID=3469 RepID=UPI000E705282|nr:uncharacterized protein LOC113360252 [Papaver somniferum]
MKEKNYLFQTIARTVLQTILDTGSAKDIWDSMKKNYQGSDRIQHAQLQALKRDFEVLNMKAGESMNGYFSRTLTIVNKMRQYKGKDLNTISIDELQSNLLVHKQRMNVHVEEEQALKVTYGESSRRRGHGGFLGRGRGRGRYNFDMYAIECFGCHNLRHFQYECPHKTEEKAYYVETGEEMLLMSYKDEAVKDHDEVFTGVFYVLDLTNNLLSIGKLVDKGLRIVIEQGRCEIYHPHRVMIMHISMSSNRMFKLYANVKRKENMCFSVTEDVAKLCIDDGNDDV